MKSLSEPGAFFFRIHVFSFVQYRIFVSEQINDDDDDDGVHPMKLELHWATVGVLDQAGWSVYCTTIFALGRLSRALTQRNACQY